MECIQKTDFDFSCGKFSPHYFKSSFAKLCAVENSRPLYGVREELEGPGDEGRSAREEPGRRSASDGLNKTRRSLSMRYDSRPTHKSSNGGQADSDLIKLRKECQSLLEENRWLRGAPGNALQSQADILQWQLRHSEASRRAHRQVLEQVAKFLGRAHTALGQPELRPRRTRSVYSVDSSACALPRAQSSAQGSAPDYTAFRDFTWRRPKISQLTPENLSKEAFRLLRTVESLLSTREPELAQRYTPSIPEESRASPSIAEENRTDLLEHRFQSLDVQDDGIRGVDLSPIHSSESAPAVSTVSSTEDESGFSSMGSFQEVGLPPLPLMPPSHRRWSSSPAHTVDLPPLHVLWV